MSSRSLNLTLATIIFLTGCLSHSPKKEVQAGNQLKEIPQVEPAAKIYKFLGEIQCDDGRFVHKGEWEYTEHDHKRDWVCKRRSHTIFFIMCFNTSPDQDRAYLMDFFDPERSDIADWYMMETLFYYPDNVPCDTLIVGDQETYPGNHSPAFLRSCTDGSVQIKALSQDRASEGLQICVLTHRKVLPPYQPDHRI